MTMGRGKKIAYFFWGSCLVLLMIALILWLFIFRFRAYTNDAYVEGNQVFITPLHPGFVTSIHTDDTFLVEKGQLLVELDKTDARLALDQAEEILAQTVREVCQAFHEVFAQKADIEVKKAGLILTAQDFHHREGVLAAEGVSLENYQHAVAALRAGYFSLQATETLYQKALSLVQGTSIKTHPRVLAAAYRLREAWVQLYRCNIYSPVEGLAAQRTIQVGMQVNGGQPLLSVIPLDQIWVNANYKETQLKRMRIGQKVKITSDLYGRDIIFHGKVVGLPGGAGNAFSLLPPQNLSGNWIKIVQRLPVRVELDPEEIKHHPLRIGLSMEATTYFRDQQGELVPTSTVGSPLYQTPIFEEEEKGDRECVEEVINANLDPTLIHYADDPIHLEPLVPMITDPEELKQFFPKLKLSMEEDLKENLFPPEPKNRCGWEKSTSDFLETRYYHPSAAILKETGFDHLR